jgi:hypothetical protein
MFGPRSSTYRRRVAAVTALGVISTLLLSGTATTVHGTKFVVDASLTIPSTLDPRNAAGADLGAITVALTLDPATQDITLAQVQVASGH